MSTDDRFIFKDLCSSSGGDESTRMYIEIDTRDGDSTIVIKKSVSCRMPIQKIKEAKDLYERLTCGNGRQVFTPEDLALKR